MDIITIEDEVIAEYEEKKSLFLAYLFPCASKEEFEAKLLEVELKHSDARHSLKVYRITKALEYASEDKEPIKSSHIILEILKKNDIEEIGLIMVRYFGGTLLGASNLEKAYIKVFTVVYNNSIKVKYLDLPVYSIKIANKEYGRLIKLLPDLVIENCQFNGPDVEMEIFGIDAVNKLAKIGINSVLEVRRTKSKIRI